MSDSAGSFERAGQGGPRLGWGRLLLVAMALAFLAMSVGSARQKSVTVDELGHLPSGVYTLASGDVRHATLNPPLLNALAALPVLAMSLTQEVEPPPASDDVMTFWSSGYHFQERHRGDYLRIFDAARWIPILLVVALGVLVFCWANALAADAAPFAGLVAAALLWFSPNVIAHARLVGTDTGTALFVALAVYAFRAMARRPDLVRVALCGFALGLAQLTKFYGLLLYPLFVVLMWLELRDGEPARGSRAQTWAACGAAFVLSLVVLNAGYGFAEFGVSLGDLVLRSEAARAWQTGLVGALPLPLPAGFIRAFDGQLVEVTSGIRSFLLGTSFQGGRADYYLILLAIKTPLLWFGVFAVAAVATIKGLRMPRRELALLLGYPAVLLLVLSFSSHRQLGARALLSAVPFVAIWMAIGWVRFFGPPRRARACALLAVGLLGTALLAYPDYLAYFNALGGGRDGGYRYASDSNIDIGQDLVGLARYLEEVQAEQVQLFYFGSVDPALYGIEYSVPADYRLQPGYLAVSVSLYRMSYDVYDHGRLRKVGPVDVSSLGEPVAVIGGTIHVYRLRAEAE